MNHDFNLKEKVLILVLVLILMALGYYKFVDEPIKTGMEEAEYAYSDLESEYDMLTIKVMQLQKMKEEMDNIDTSASKMESYNASKQEMSFLNELLSETIDYNITFEDVTRVENQIRRPFILQYTAKDYAEAKRILTELYNSEYRCLINNVDIKNDGEFYGLNNEPVTIALKANFYETMVGGIEDAGLPVVVNTADTLENEAEAEDGL